MTKSHSLPKAIGVSRDLGLPLLAMEQFWTNWDAWPFSDCTLFFAMVGAVKQREEEGWKEFG